MVVARHCTFRRAEQKWPPSSDIHCAISAAAAPRKPNPDVLVNLLPSINASIKGWDLIHKTLNNRSSAIAWQRMSSTLDIELNSAHSDLSCRRLNAAQKWLERSAVVHAHVQYTFIQPVSAIMPTKSVAHLAKAESTSTMEVSPSLDIRAGGKSVGSFLT